MARLILSIAALLLGVNGTAAQAKRPNIVFVFSDDQRADTIAALGNGHITTPNLDKLVRRGTTLTRAYCMGAQQGAVCVPSRAMMLTGRSLFRIQEQLRGQTTWPEMFARAGYVTFMTGKWHNGPESLTRIFPDARAVFLGGMTDTPFHAPVSDVADKKLTDKRDSGKHTVELFTDSVVDFIRRQKKEQPFLAYVAYNLPHDPRLAPKEYHRLYDPAKMPLPGNFLPVHPFNNGDMVLRDEKLAPWPRTKEMVRQHLADYYAAITFLDAQIGRIFDVLKEAGLDDNTIIVFASDHGLAIGSHGLFGKQNLYDHSMHAPLIFAGPGVPTGQKSPALCYLFDIYPTLGKLAAVKGPDGSEGKSLVAAMRDPVQSPRDALLTAYRKVQRAVCDDRWHLIVYPHINKAQLFDLANDPEEVKDLAADPTHAEQLRRMMALLQAQQQFHGDAEPLRSPNPQPTEFVFPKGKKE